MLTGEQTTQPQKQIESRGNEPTQAQPAQEGGSMIDRELSTMFSDFDKRFWDLEKAVFGSPSRRLRLDKPKKSKE